VVAKKNIPTAVQRNRIKRLIRDSFRHQEPQAVNLDLVVLVRKGTDKLPNSAINTAIAKLWQDAATKSLRKHSGS
jgi:ribonuclease P protein component